MNLPMGTVISGRYEVIEKLGSGGMAIVYRAKDLKLERFVTVKILRDEFTSDEEFKARFKIEARSAASLSHPNIVNVYDVGEDGTIYYIVMEYVHGDTLKKAIQQKAPFDSLTTISVAIQMASALSHAHKNHIVHRDIKPQNILVATDGTIKVTDFGIARAATAATVTTTANAIGSVHYFSPEQARGGYVDEKSDIYSLGITMFEMATGKPPYDGDTSVAIALKHLNDELPNIRDYNPDISRSLEGIIRKATRKKADERYASIDMLLSDLKKSLSDSSIGLGARSNSKSSEEREIEFLQINKKKNIDEAIHRPATREPLPPAVPVKRTKSKEVELPESNVGFDKYRKKLKISKDDDYNDKYEEPLDDDYEDDDDDEYMDRSREKKVVIAAVITALVIISVITVFGFRLLNKESKPDKNATTENSVVPDLTGLTMVQAENKVAELGFTVEKMGEEESSVYDEGQIISQDISEGQTIGEDKKIKVTLSNGLKSYDMPDVVSMEENEAISAIKEKGSQNVERQYENDETVAVGKVISQQPAKGTKINKDSKIILTISKGEEMTNTTVPDVEGDTESAAKKKLSEANLKVGTVTNMESTKVEKGIVITQTVSAGQEVVKDTVVGLVVSSGKPEQPEEKKPEETKPDETKPDETPPAADNQKPSDSTNGGQNTDTPIGGGTTAPSNKSVSFPVYAPIVEEGTESVHIKIIQIGEGGSEKTVLDSTKAISEFPFNISVSGSGQAEVQCYVDGSYQWSENVNFTEGGN